MEANQLLWGTIPSSETGDRHKILNEQELEVAMNAMETEPHEPETEDEKKKDVETGANFLKLVPAECSKMNPIVLNTIGLIQYAKRVTELTNKIYTQKEDLTAEVQNINEIPPLLEISPTHKDRLPDEESDFVLGKGKIPFSLCHHVRNQILHKCVSTLAAQRGYDFATSTALEVLTSVTSDLINKICRLLKLAVDSSPSTPVDYLKCLEKVFHDMNLGNLRSFNSYFKSEIIDYQKKMRQNCEKLLEELHIANAAVISKLLREEQMNNDKKYEMEFKQDDDDIPLLHFPASEDGHENDEIQFSLEPGFQMLHNLEQEQLQMGNADGERSVLSGPQNQFASNFMPKK